MTLIIPLIMVCFLCGGALSLLPRWGERNYWGSLALAGLGSLIIFGCGVYFMIDPMDRGAQILDFGELVEGLPAFTISVYADRLAALFLILTGGLSIAAVLHMFDCLAEIPDRSRIVAAYNIFILSIAFTILANAVFMFLLSLECITLSYAYLVLFQHNQNVENSNAPGETIQSAKTAFKSYLIFEHAGSLLVLIALMLVSVQSAGRGLPVGGCRDLHGFFPDPLGFNFDVLRCFIQRGGEFSGPAANLIFLFALLGFGIKAGMFPTHVWVPLVHPFSPPSFSALTSTVGLAVSGLYSMYRVFIEFSGPGEFWWGLLVLLLAGASALTGAFYGMLGRDLKTALASYSIQHVGIILAGIGLAMIYRWAEQYAGTLSIPLAASVARSFRMLTVLSLIASLYHLANHAIFKSLLYFAEGAIENRTGTTALDRLGGLIKRYPWTSAAFLVGALSIAGLPPFNGFASEWLTLQAMFAGMNLFLPGFEPRIFLLVGLVAALLCLALAFGITALGFVKIAGEILLGAPRDAEVARRSRPEEVSWRIRSVLVVLAGLCLLMGLLPSVTAHGLSQVARDLSTVPSDDPLQISTLNLAIHIPVFEAGAENSLQEIEEGYQTRLSGRLLFALAGILAFPFLLHLALLFSKWGSHLRLRRGPIWTGGAVYRPEEMQVTGSAFSSQVWMAFEVPKSSLTLAEDAGTSAEAVFPIAEPLTEQRAVPEIFRLLYDSAVRRLMKIVQRFGDWAQPGDIRRYLFYIFIVLLIVLALLLQLSGAGGSG